MIRFLINIYIFILVGDAVLSYFPQVRAQQWAAYIRKAADMTCKPIRQILPPDLPFDPSPMIVIFALKLIEAIW